MHLSPFQIGIVVAVGAVAAFLFLRKPSAHETVSEPPSNLQPGPIRQERLADVLEARVTKFETVFAEVYPRTHKDWIDGFRRDVHPESEIAIWEAIASAYQSFIEKRQLSLDAKKEVFGLLLVRSSADDEHTLSSAKFRHISRSDAEDALRR
jgi:hypothetical protein